MTKRKLPPVLIREVRHADAAALAELVTLWGYPADDVAVARRLSGLATDTDAVFVAAVEEEAVGWVHVSLYQTLATDDAAELRGLVVDEKWRRQGIGRQLMDAAERWARQHGCRTMYVRTRLSRQQAHAFYRQLGYRQIKTSFTFVRALHQQEDGSEPRMP